ncbi:MAG: hypothetical protein JNK81_00510 [Anaerolineales bacterium]|nr:hypothetical protein [Anaerolineales bacterium]
MKKIIFIVLALVLAACGGGGTSSEFDQNVTKWNDAGVSHYRMQVGVSCFCPFADINPITVEVKDGQIVSMVGANGAEVLDTDPAYVTLAQYANVDSLFTWLGDALANADKVEVTYDATYGFPTSIAVDFITEATDDEIWIDISNFEVVE